MTAPLGRIFSYGTNHHYSPIALRESLHLSREQIASVLPRIRDRYKIPELALLSTCNRIEMYGVSPHSQSCPVTLSQVFHDCQLLAKKTNLAKIDDISRNAFCFSGRSAIRHVFDVAASIDSLVVGETQITGQFKEAFHIAQEVSTLGPQLHQLSTSALNIAKKIRTETVIGRKTVSIGHAAIDLSQRVFSDLSSKNLVILGAGDMAHATGLYARKRGVRKISVLNRTLAHAEELVEELGGGKTGLLTEMLSFLREADIVVTAVSSDTPIIHAELLKEALSRRQDRPIFLVDIAVPRNVDHDCANFENVYLFDLDDLQKYIDENVGERKSAAVEAQKIIDLYLERFCSKLLQSQDTIPLGPFKNYLEKLLEQEREKSFSKKSLGVLNEDQNEALESMLHSVSKKMTTHFALALKNGSHINKSDISAFLHEISKF